MPNKLALPKRAAGFSVTRATPKTRSRRTTSARVVKVAHYCSTAFLPIVQSGSRCTGNCHENRWTDCRLGSTARLCKRRSVACPQRAFGHENMARKSGLAGAVLRRTARAALLALLASLMLTAWPQQKSTDLTNESIEDLMNIQVTSVSKTEQNLSQAASAVFVITPDDIRHSDATNIPELLRMVPGLDVARINANTWAVSTRGFNARFSSELLVLMDGRTVYTPTTGGVFWDVLDLPLGNVERIEVIRGPGASVWGANAVNGVINIITKKASETQGTLLVAGDGNVEQGFGTIQYGGRAGKSTDYRVYAKYLNQGRFPSLAGADGGDGWRMLRGGFRSDSVLSSKDTLMFQGDLYRGREGTPTSEFVFTPAPVAQNLDLLVNLSGGFLQGVWNHTLSSHSNTSLQLSYDAYERNDQLRESRRTFDLDFQHNFSGWTRQNIVWGLTYRYSASRSDGILGISLVPADLNTQLFSSFIQDEIAIVPDRLFLTVGAKLEHNYYTGFGTMPGARVAWTPTKRHTLWAAISKTERTPSETDVALRAPAGLFPGPGGIPVLLTLFGNPHIDNEESVDYEMGYRTMVSRQLSIDFTAYYNEYSHQETSEPSTPFLVNTPSPHLVLPLVFENLMHGETHGMEIAVNWKAADRWTLSPGYAFEQIHMHLAPTSQDTTSVSEAQGSSPVNAAQLRSHLALAPRLTWDTSAYFVGRLTDPEEPSYTRLDTGLSWELGERIGLRLVGQNLLRDRHEEFVDTTGSTMSTLIKRSAYAKVEWRF
jgi:iron complex outermembrane receptor protein